MKLSIDVHLDYAFPEPADVLLQVEVAATHDQWIDAESLVVRSDHSICAVTGEDGVGQRCWARGEGRLSADYRATVTIDRPSVALETLPETSVRPLPGPLVPYLLPSRYCEADRFERFVRREFRGASGGTLAARLRDWVRAEIAYESGASDARTGALETFAERRGVCRDFAHLLVALARAGEIPARCVSAYAPGVDPPDFHAVAELWLDGAWHLIDATGMAECGEIARVAVGRDATDIAFMTIFGRADLIAQTVKVDVIA